MGVRVDDNMRFTLTIDREKRVDHGVDCACSTSGRGCSRRSSTCHEKWMAPRGRARSLAASLSAQQKESANYVIGPEDVLTVTVFNEPGLSGRFRVENDGHFNYPFLGRIHAGGVTISDVATILKAKLSEGYLRNPQVTVDVDQFRSQSVFVMGEVRSPGKYVLSGSVSLLEVLAQAGSTTAAGGFRDRHPASQVTGRAAR